MSQFVFHANGHKFDSLSTSSASISGRAANPNHTSCTNRRHQRSQAAYPTNRMLYRLSRRSEIQTEDELREDTSERLNNLPYLNLVLRDQKENTDFICIFTFSRELINSFCPLPYTIFSLLSKYFASFEKENIEGCIETYTIRRSSELPE